MRLFIKERTRLDRGFHSGFWNRLQVSADTEPASPSRRLSPLPDPRWRLALACVSATGGRFPRVTSASGKGDWPSEMTSLGTSVQVSSS